MLPSLGVRGRSCYMNLRVGVALVVLVNMQICMRSFAVSTTLMPASITTKVTSMPASNITEMTSITTSNITEMTTAVPTTATSYRLPTSVYPLHYNLELQTYINYTDPSNFTFRGSVQILVRCVNATDTIVLHVNGLTVDNASIKLTPETRSVSGDPKYSTWEKDKERHFFIVRLDSEMDARRNYWIQMNFTAPLRNDNTGLYYSKSKRGNQTVYTVVSQFEPVSARAAFPCFDEPAMRATFNVTIVRPADRISLSNMPIDHSDFTFHENGTTYVKDVYQQTPNMPTYLLAFVVCDFMNLSITKNNVTYRTWAELEFLNATQHVLDILAPMTEFLGEYFGIKYTLPKLDNVGVADFKFGAMENWGLIVYKEINMLYEEGVTRQELWNGVTRIAAHEIVHMWLGNIVTISWWSDHWLKEASSSYFELMAVDAVKPEWKTFDRFVIDRLQIGFRYDEADSKPMYSYAETPKGIEELMRDVNYLKGPSVIRMLKFVLGDSTFRAGYSKFLKKHSYSAVHHDQFYSDLTEQARSDGLDIDVKKFMDTWVLQANFPVVTVTRDCNDSCSLQVTQERFLQYPTATRKCTKSPFNCRWNIPLTFASSNYILFNQTREDVYWLNKADDTKLVDVDMELPECSDPNGWILANVQQYGFYRVNYDYDNWMALSRQLKRNHSVIPSNNRAQIINDAWSLFWVNYIPLDTALATFEYLHDEREYSPWYAANPEISYLMSSLILSPVDAAFRSFWREKLTPPFRQFGLVNITRDFSDKFTQVLVADLACSFGVQSCWDQALQVYRSLMETDGEQFIDPDIKATVLCYGIAAGSTEEWEYAVDMYNMAASTEKDAILTAMACSHDTQILNRYLSALLHGDATFPDISSDNATFPDISSGNAKFQDTSKNNTTFSAKSNDPKAFTDDLALTIVNKVIDTRQGRSVAWKFYRNNYEKLINKYNSTLHCEKVLSRLTSAFNSKQELKEVNDFRDQFCDTYNKTNFKHTVIQHITTRIYLLEIDVPIIKTWLIKNGIIAN